MIATFGVSSAGVPAIHELQDKLVRESRAFVKGLHYTLSRTLF
jgi:hypothetical protein